MPKFEAELRPILKDLNTKTKQALVDVGRAHLITQNELARGAGVRQDVISSSNSANVVGPELMGKLLVKLSPTEKELDTIMKPWGEWIELRGGIVDQTRDQESRDRLRLARERDWKKEGYADKRPNLRGRAHSPAHREALLKGIGISMQIRRNSIPEKLPIDK